LDNGAGVKNFTLLRGSQGVGMGMLAGYRGKTQTPSNGSHLRGALFSRNYSIGWRRKMGSSRVHVLLWRPLYVRC
jgi:hypothetical protein